MTTKSIAFVFAVLAVSMLVVGCSGGSAEPETPAGEPVTGDSNADAAIDAAIIDENDDVEIGELIE